MTTAPGRPSRAPALALAALALTLVAAGCGSSEEPASSSAGSSPSAASSPSAEASPSATTEDEPEAEEGTVIDITVADGAVSPQGKSLQVAVGEPVTLRVESDAPGELHIHSTPEQELAFEAGTTEKELTLDRPGVVDVESHDLDQLLVRLEVR